MKIRNIPRGQSLSHALPGIFLLIILCSGFFLVRFLEKVGTGYLRGQNENIIEAMTAGIQNEFQTAQSSVSAMAGSPWILPLFLDPNSKNLENAHSVLDRYNTSLGFSVCYLLDAQGTTVASSNRNAPDSFVGQNYAFRPYFQEALRGKSSFYMASGVTSQERGFYVAHPVKDSHGKIVGVATIKKNIDLVRNVLGGYPHSFYISPDGIVFISGSKEMVFKALWPLDEERIRAIKDSQQFGEMSFEPVFPKPFQAGERVRFRGEFYQSFQRPLGPPGWSLVLLASLKSVYYFIFFGWMITAFMASLILILMVWTFLRFRDQGLLKKSEERYHSLFLNSRDAIMVLQPPSWKFVSGNPATLEMFRATNEKEFTALGPWDLSPKLQPDGSVSAQKAREIIEATVLEGFRLFEWTHRRLGGEEFPATVLLTRIGLGQEVFLLATVRDITLQKQAEEELRLKVTELERFNKVAVGRELKMIELKEKLKILEEGKRPA